MLCWYCQARPLRLFAMPIFAPSGLRRQHLEKHEPLAVVPHQKWIGDKSTGHIGNVRGRQNWREPGWRRRQVKWRIAGLYPDRPNAFRRLKIGNHENSISRLSYAATQND